MSECIILIGLQGAGKTTLYRQRFAAYEHVSMDRFPSARNKTARLMAEITRALDAGRSVVVDNTNPTIAVRGPLIRLARSQGAEVVGYYVEATTAEAVARNRKRGGKARISDVGVFATARRFQPPLKAEGFHQLYRTRLGAHGAFTDEEWVGDMSRFRNLAWSGADQLRGRLYIPPGYDERSGSWPLIVFLHGRDESGRDNISQTTVGLGPALVRHPERWPFVALLPQKPDPHQPWATYRSALVAMVKATRAAYPIDASRQYLSGVSQGAHETWELGVECRDDWAALAPICGYGAPAEYATALREMPIWCFHGEVDRVVPHACSVAIIQAIEREGGRVRFTSYPGVGHDAWEPAYAEPDLPSWLQQHTSVRS